jgi:hypothetical protein
MHQIPDLAVLGGERAEVSAGPVLVAEQEGQRRMTGQRGPDEVEGLGPLGRFGLAVVLAAQLGDGTLSTSATFCSTDIRSTGRTPRSTWDTQLSDRPTSPANSTCDRPSRLRW